MVKKLFEWDYSSYSGAKKYPHIFSSIKIGKLLIPNRIKYAATEDNLNDKNGFITDAGVAYMKSRAEGVVGGLCFMQGVYMDSNRKGQGYVGQAAAWHNKYIPGLKRIADAIHEKEAIAGFQLMDCGRVGAVETDSGHGPSTIPQRLRIFKPMFEMTIKEIEEMVQQHVEAAKRGVEAGFDIIEISGIVGYLLSNFISSYTNRRTDKYGGDINNRMRVVTDIIKETKKALPSYVPLGIRLCAEELLDDVKGNTPEESMESYKIAEEAGADYLSVTAGWQESVIPVISRDVPMGSWIHLAKRAKKHISIPVQMAYRLFKPELPEKAIASGELDIWEMCRPMIADPYMPKKILEDTQNEIRHCVACNLCLARLFRDAPMTCYINPTCAHEHDINFLPKSTDDKKEVLIIGAGPSGMECAYVAAQRGHDVEVYDKQKEIGGSLLDASKAPYGDEELLTCVEYQKTMAKKYGVKFYLNTEVTSEIIADKLPDVVILATGPRYPQIKKMNTENKKIVSIQKALHDGENLGEHIIIWGNRKPGIGTALALAKKGKKITIVGPEKTAGFDVNPSFKWRYMIYLRQNKINAYNGCNISAIEDNKVLITTYDGYSFPVKYDNIVLSHRSSNDAFKKVLLEEGIEYYIIGDALVPRNLSSAIHDGYRIGLRI